MRGRLRDLANQRPRFGYSWRFILPLEQGGPSGINRIYQFYREEGLTVRRRKAQRRAIPTRTPVLDRGQGQPRWPLESVHYQFTTDRTLQTLTIIDTFSEFSPEQRNPAGDDRIVVDHIPISIRRRCERKLDLAPQGTSNTMAILSGRSDNAMIKAIARA